MAKEIFKSTIKRRMEAAKAIIKAEMAVAQKQNEGIRIYLDKRDGSIATISGKWHESTLKPKFHGLESSLTRDRYGILLWNAESPRDISEIYSMEMTLDTPEQKNISWIEHYLTVFFEDEIAWEFELGEEK